MHEEKRIEVITIKSGSHTLESHLSINPNGISPKSPLAKCLHGETPKTHPRAPLLGKRWLSIFSLLGELVGELVGEPHCTYSKSISIHGAPYFFSLLTLFVHLIFHYLPILPYSNLKHIPPLIYLPIYLLSLISYTPPPFLSPTFPYPTNILSIYYIPHHLFFIWAPPLKLEHPH